MENVKKTRFCTNAGVGCFPIFIFLLISLTLLAYAVVSGNVILILVSLLMLFWVSGLWSRRILYFTDTCYTTLYLTEWKRKIQYSQIVKVEAHTFHTFLGGVAFFCKHSDNKTVIVSEFHSRSNENAVKVLNFLIEKIPIEHFALPSFETIGIYYKNGKFIW